MTRSRRSFVVLISVLAASALLLPPAGAGNDRVTARVSKSAPAAAPAGSTPALIEAAVARGELSRSTADRYLAYAIANPSRLPAAYRSSVSWRGTLPLLDLQERADAVGTSVARLAGTVERGAADGCGGYSSRTSHRRATKHFLVRYDASDLRGGLTIRNYARALETSWRTEVGRYGWPRPPLKARAGGRYHVRIENLGAGLYGFVTSNGASAGYVGNNPATRWADHDAFASCMVLNQDYRGFPSAPLASLQATAAHEFNHSIQFGMGGLTGVGRAEDVFIEGGATWMEDEVFDNANDSYSYLWPPLGKSLGEYGSGFAIYRYWVMFRALTERFGTGVAGGGENVMQEFWEQTSRERAANLNALDAGLRLKGVSLAPAFHAAAIAVRLSKPCGGGYVYPYCMEEGAAYRNRAGTYGDNRVIGSVGGSASARLRDNYAAHFVALPASGGIYDVALFNDDTGGRLHGSVVCDTGSALAVNAMSRVAGGGQKATLNGFDPAGCTSVVLAITNQAQRGANPSSSPARNYSVETS